MSTFDWLTLGGALLFAGATLLLQVRRGSLQHWAKLSRMSERDARRVARFLGASWLILGLASFVVAVL